MTEKKTYHLIPVITLPPKKKKRDYGKWVRVVYDERKLILGFLLGFLFLGIVVFLGSKKMYTSEVLVLPEYHSDSGNNQLSGLAGQFGGMMGGSGFQTYRGSSDAIRTELYPNILKSTPLLYSVMHDEFLITSYDTTASLYTYINELDSPSFISYVYNYTIGLPFTILRWIRSSGDEDINARAENELPGMERDVITMSRSEFETLKYLRDQISSRINIDDGVFEIQVTLSDPELAARVANNLLKKMTDYVVDYRLDKHIRDLEFIDDRSKEAEQRFNAAQEELAIFRDENRNVTTQRAQIQEERLRSEYEIAYGLYSTLANQREEKKLKIQEETPVFKLLEAPQAPIEASYPQFLNVIMMFLILGMLLASVAMVIKWYLGEQKLQNGIRQ